MKMSEQLAAAVSAIILEKSSTRFQVYLVNASGEISVLWPEHDAKGKAEKLLPLMIASNNQKLPRYHWRLCGGGYSKASEIAEVLLKYNAKLKIYQQSGLYLSEVR